MPFSGSSGGSASSRNQPVSSTQLSPAEQALKAKIDKFNQRPEVNQGEELVHKYLKLQNTAAIIKSVVAETQPDSQIAAADKDLIAAKVKTANQHLLNQAADFLSASKSFTHQPDQTETGQ